jgi:hypothetical protein
MITTLHGSEARLLRILPDWKSNGKTSPQVEIEVFTKTGSSIQWVRLKYLKETKKGEIQRELERLKRKDDGLV